MLRGVRVVWCSVVLLVGWVGAGCECGAPPPAAADAGPSDGGGAQDAAADAGPADAGADAGSDAGFDGGFDGGLDAGSCPPPPACDLAAPVPDPQAAWRHPVATALVVLGAPRHRGRDLFLLPTDPQWALAKFAYGALDDDLKDEDVDVWLLRDCTTWERLGTATTTNDGDHATVEGVEDSGGWVYLRIPAARALGVGRHRLRFVVRGDHTTADQYLEVLPATARFAVSDVDGTLTDNESAAFTSLLTGTPPGANDGAASALWALARRGYHLFYLTARPEWLAATTHEWLASKGFPPGNVHTTLTATGATGAPAATFKISELAEHQTRFPESVTYAFGNTATDLEAYSVAGVSPANVYSYLFDPNGLGTRHDDYRQLVPVFNALPTVCR